MRLAGVLALFVSGCSLVFDGTEPDLPLLGAPPERASLARLNHGPAGRAAVILGRDRAHWATFLETFATPAGPRRGYRAVRLSPPAAEEVLLGDDFVLTYRAFFRSEREGEAARTRLSIHSAGEGGHWDVFELPGGPAQLFIGGADDVFVYWPRDKDTTEVLLQQRDRSFARMIPVPPGVDPTDPYGKGEFAFTYDGKWFITRDAADHMVLYAARSDETRDLGRVPGGLALTNAEILACGPEGLLAVGLADGVHRQLDAAPCQDEGYSFRDEVLYYYAAGETRRVPLDGSRAPEPVLAAGRRLLGFGPDGAVLHTRLPPNSYVNDASDGWLGEWRFMERGRAASYSSRKGRLRWLERGPVLGRGRSLLGAGDRGRAAPAGAQRAALQRARRRAPPRAR